MKFRTLLALIASGQMGMLWSLARDVKRVYRTAFLAEAASSGVLSNLTSGPQSSEQLAARLGLPDDAREGFEAWLHVGVAVGVLRSTPRGFRLRGKLAKGLARPDHDPLAAMLRQALSLHRRLIMETPERLHPTRPFTMADQDGTLIARVSRLFEPFIADALDAVLPLSGPFTLLDVGCGEGRYLRHACLRNRELRGVGLELQDDVAAVCRRNVEEWGLADRLRIEVGDVRNVVPRAEFDLVTLHNLIYYFPLQSRVGVLGHLRGLLNPRGRLMVTTACPSNQPTLAVLNLWATMTAGCGRLATPGEMAEQLRAAGFVKVERRQLIPGGGLLAFTASA